MLEAMLSEQLSCLYGPLKNISASWNDSLYCYWPTVGLLYDLDIVVILNFCISMITIVKSPGVLAGAELYWLGNCLKTVTYIAV